MNILSDPCCITAIAVLVIYGVAKFIALIVSKYRRRSGESALTDICKLKTVFHL